MYYLTKKSDLSFDQALDRITEELKKVGFGIVFQLDVKNTFKEKIGKDFRNYKILGACNPGLAFQALNMDDKLGTVIPCNVIVQEHIDGKTEISIINPIEQFSIIGNEQMEAMASTVKEYFETALSNI